MTFPTRTTTITLALALLAGCATNPQTPRAGTAPQAEASTPPAPTPRMVDPWARSVEAAPSTPVRTAEAPEAAEPSAAPEAEPAASTTGGRTHTVAKGETLYQISVKYYGTGTKWPNIVDANPGLKPERMPVGKQIVIP